MRTLSRRRVSLLVILFFGSLAFIGEVGVFYVYSSYWDFPQRGIGSEVVKVLLVSSPRIQGIKNENKLLGWFTRWDEDRYLSRTFAAACSHVQPEVVVFLGDLIDEGTTATDSEFRRYHDRFKMIFKVCGGARAVYLPGESDIGGESETVKWETVQRFAKHFGKPNFVMNFKGLDFVKINTVIWLRRGLTSSQDERNFLEEFSLFLGVVRDDRLSSHAPIVFSHLPMSACTEARQMIFNDLHPRVVFSGRSPVAHEQKFEIEEEENGGLHGREGSLDVVDYTVPTCNYRMEVNGIGYGAALLGADGKAQMYTVLWLPPRYPILFAYLISLTIYCSCKGFTTCIRNRPF